MFDADTLGSELRAARESRDLTLEQAEKQTRIRAHYLEALEQGNFSALPSAVQGRGFLRNYARFLGLDAELLVARFDAAIRGGGSRRGRRQPPVFADDPTLDSTARRTITREATGPVKTVTGQMKAVNVTAPSQRMPAVAPTSAETRRRRNRNMTLGTLIIVTISVMALVILIFYSAQPNGGSLLSPILTTAPTLAPTTETIQDQITLTPIPSRPTALPNPNGSATPAVIQAGAGGLSIQITVVSRALISVTTDGQVQYNGSAGPGEVLTYTAKNTIQLHTGNAGGIEVVVNGIPQEPLGQYHEIVDKTYSLNDPGLNAPVNRSPQATATTAVSIGPPPTNTVFAAALAIPTKTNLPTASPLAALPSQAPATTLSTLLPPTKTAIRPSLVVTTIQPTIPLPATSTRTPSATVSPLPTRTASLTPTATITLTASRTPIFLPHDTITPDSRAN